MKNKLSNIGPILLVFVVIAIFWLIVISVLKPKLGKVVKKKYTIQEVVFTTPSLKLTSEFYNDLGDSINCIINKGDDTTSIIFNEIRLVYVEDLLYSGTIGEGKVYSTDSSLVIIDPMGNQLNMK